MKTKQVKKVNNFKSQVGVIMSVAQNMLERDLPVLPKKIGKKRVCKVSEKRQVTIPKDFYDALGIEKEVEFFFVPETKELILSKPQNYVQNEDEIDEFLLKKLIREGYKDEELIRKFKEEKALLKKSE